MVRLWVGGRGWVVTPSRESFLCGVATRRVVRGRGREGPRAGLTSLSRGGAPPLPFSPGADYHSRVARLIPGGRHMRSLLAGAAVAVLLVALASPCAAKFMRPDL